MRTTELDHLERVNRAIDYVLAHLDGDLRLATVARATGFSPFHFHRVFQAATGETLHRFVKRVRLERALFHMAHDPGRSLTEIALHCGFGSSSDFSRSFRQRYGVAPSAFDLAGWRGSHRRTLQSLADGAAFRLERLPVGDNPDGFCVTVRELPPRTVAYVRVLDPYRQGVVVDACERLVAWAEARGLADGQWLGFQWEDPDLVALEDCRYDVAVVVPEVVPEGEVGRATFPAMTVAEVALDGGIDLEQRALDWLFGSWLPASGYSPADHPCFEAWVGRPFAHGMERFTLAVQLPVRVS